ncbi:BCCT family transporter [Kocuria palustris]|uniref:BCCT family transporter n=1 Tax=Kocuria palustris TaxID=71999 RepID=UPI00077B7129|nr:BCCT family transporter [Kocuria palustris]
MLTRLHDRLGLRTSPQIIFSTSGFVVVFAIIMVVFPDGVAGIFGSLAAWITANLGWFYVTAITCMLIFAFSLAMSRYGRIKLGDDDAEPEYSGLAWFGMLFAAGVGAVLMFWGVAEPVTHYADPPMYGVEPQSVQAASDALGIANFHFGLHMWGIFIVPGLAFAYFTYKRKLPPRVSSSFQPLLGDGIHGPIGKTIDSVAVIATIFGLAVSIGQGAMQINGGLDVMYGIPMSGWLQALIVAVITAAALVSVVAGMDKGVKRLSYANIFLAIALLLYLLMFGATTEVLKGTVESAGRYLAMLPTLSFFNTAWGESDWTGTWTVFYFAWTATWAPFVGMFIAKISRGRTIREFVIAVLIIPSLFVLCWIGIMGVNAFRIQREGGNLVETIVDEGNVPASLFEFLGHFPLLELTAVVALVLITVFFITSLDSGALVLDAMASGHEDEAPVRQRVFWTLAVGAICVSLLLGAGEDALAALQEVIKVIGLPITAMMFVQALMVIQAVREDFGGARPIRTRQWKQVLPLEEYHRRSQDDDVDMSEYTMRPDFEPGTEPEYETHQPRTWRTERGATGQLPAVQPGDLQRSARDQD